MATLPAEGPITEAEDLLRIMLCDSAEVQRFLGVTSSTDALTRIHIDALPISDNGEQYTKEEAEELRPYILVSTRPDNGYLFTLDAADRSFVFRDSGSLMAQFVRSIHEDDLTNPRNADRRFKNQLGLILNELKSMAGRDSYFAATGGRFSGPDQRHPDRDHDEGAYQFANIEFTWGQDA